MSSSDLTTNNHSYEENVLDPAPEVVSNQKTLQGAAVVGNFRSIFLRKGTRNWSSLSYCLHWWKINSVRSPMLNGTKICFQSASIQPRFSKPHQHSPNSSPNECRITRMESEGEGVVIWVRLEWPKFVRRLLFAMVMIVRFKTFGSSFLTRPFYIQEDEWISITRIWYSYGITL